jgi:hypothetical protein
MELDPKTISRVWWKGAATSAAKGIPQGLMLGAIAAVVLFGVIAGAMLLAPTAPIAMTTAQAFGGFLYSHSVAVALATEGLTMATATSLVTSIASISLVPIMLFNTVLTSVGNFLTGGKIAVNAYKQDIEHRMNEARITQVEQRQLQLAPQAPARSQAVQRILANGPRNTANFAQAETERAADAPNGQTIH